MARIRHLEKAPITEALVDFRADGFTYNRLQPYTSWDAVLPEALGLWELFVQTVVPVSITRSRSGISPHAD